MKYTTPSISKSIWSTRTVTSKEELPVSMKKTDKLQYYLTISLTKTDHKEKLIKTNYNFSIKESKHSYKTIYQAFKKKHALPMKLVIFQLHPSSAGTGHIVYSTSSLSQNKKSR